MNNAGAASATAIAIRTKKCWKSQRGEDDKKERDLLIKAFGVVVSFAEDISSSLFSLWLNKFRVGFRVSTLFDWICSFPQKKKKYYVARV